MASRLVLVAVVVAGGCAGTITEAVPAADARPGTADARPVTADARPGAADARPGAADAQPVTADARPGAADAPPGSPDARPVVFDARPGAPDAPPVTGPPRLGAHALAFHRLGVGVAPISTPAMSTMPSGSTIVVTVGRGDKSQFSLPRDNKGNSPYLQLGTVHPYTNYPNSGTAIYAFPSAQGGAGHIVTADTPPSDEITLAAVEVVNGRTIHDFKWNEVLAPNTLTSLQVTTTGPATLIAVWWGDAPEPMDKTAVPNNGFTVIDSILLSGALVQGAVATRDVSAAGSYNVTWTATPLQGAQLWLIAVQ